MCMPCRLNTQMQQEWFADKQCIKITKVKVFLTGISNACNCGPVTTESLLGHYNTIHCFPLPARIDFGTALFRSNCVYCGVEQSYTLNDQYPQCEDCSHLTPVKQELPVMFSVTWKFQCCNKLHVQLIVYVSESFPLLYTHRHPYGKFCNNR